MAKDVLSTRTARKCAEISRILEKEESRSHARRVAHILKKSESDRSSEEKTLLVNSADVVLNIEKRAHSRRLSKQRLLEVEDSEDVLRESCARLATAIRDAQHVVVYTGAGISTAASIPDYRGPNGVWTLLQQGKEVIVPQLSDAVPTYTHMCITELYRHNLVKHVVSQNCDALHLRSGLPRHALSEVHGNMNIEVCNDCDHPRECIRLFDTTERTGVRRHQTGRRCTHCGGELHDTIVHFGEKGRLTSPYNWKEAAQAADHADVILCLGTSLKVLKKYPCLWSMHKPPADRPKLYIVNLQWTPKDDVAALKINGRSDDVMRYVMSFLNLPQPVDPYCREEDPIFLIATRLAPNELDTTSTKSLVEPPGYKWEKMNALRISDIAAWQKLNSSEKSKKQKRKKQSDGCGMESRKVTEQQKSSRMNRTEGRNEISPETDALEESGCSKRCRNNVRTNNTTPPQLCDEHYEDTTRRGLRVSKSDTACTLSDSGETLSCERSQTTGALVSIQSDNSDEHDDDISDGNSEATVDNLGKHHTITHNSMTHCEELVNTSARGGECMLEHAYCRSCVAGPYKPMHNRVKHPCPSVRQCISSKCQQSDKKDGLSHESGILRKCQWRQRSPTIAVPSFTFTPSTTHGQPFTHIRTFAPHQSQCSSVGGYGCCTNVDPSIPECPTGLDANCSISLAQGFAAILGEPLPNGEHTNLTVIAPSTTIATAKHQSSYQYSKTSQSMSDATSCNLATFSGKADTAANRQFPTIIEALRAVCQPSTKGLVKRGTVDTEVTSSPEPHSESTSGVTHSCGGIKSKDSVSHGTAVIPSAKGSELQTNTSANCDKVTHVCPSSTERTTMQNTEECNTKTVSSVSPSAGPFSKKGGETVTMESDEVKISQALNSGRNTITATSPGWFGKGLSLRKTKRKKSW